MTDKTSRWSFTAYEGQYAILEAIRECGNELIAEIGWQDEICPDTQRHHRQGYVRTVRQVRFSQISAILKGIHLEKAKNWDALVNYCRKVETRDLSGSQVQLRFERPLRLHEMLIEVAKTYLRMDRPSEETLSRLDRQTDRQTLLQLLRTHAYQLVWKHPEYAIVLSRQDARDAWCNFITLWIEKAQNETGEGQ